MGTYNVTCPNIPDLDGTCVITNDDCTSYTSDSLGAATKITNTGTGTTLDFHVEFTTSAPPPGNTIKYKVKANLVGTEYDGGAEEDDDSAIKIDPPKDPDPWVATASGEPVVAAKATS